MLEGRFQDSANVCGMIIGEVNIGREDSANLSVPSRPRARGIQTLETSPQILYM